MTDAQWQSGFSILENELNAARNGVGGRDNWDEFSEVFSISPIKINQIVLEWEPGYNYKVDALGKKIHLNVEVITADNILNAVKAANDKGPIQAKVDARDTVRMARAHNIFCVKRKIS